jgi:hypothetical protein
MECPPDEDICVETGCENGSCVIVQNYTHVAFPNGTVYDCLQRILLVGTETPLVLDASTVTSFKSNDACTEIVTLDDTDTTGIMISECTEDVVVSVTLPLFDQHLISSDVTTVNVDLIAIPLTGPTITDTVTTIGPTLDTADAIQVSDCSTVTSCVTETFDGTTTTIPTTCEPTYMESSLIISFSLSSDCNNAGAKRKRALAQTSGGTITFVFTLPGSSTPVLFSDWKVVVTEVTLPETDCAHSRCYWTEHHLGCDKSDSIDLLPTSFCGLTETDILDADICDDMWLAHGNEYLTARNNHACGGYNLSPKELKWLTNAAELQGSTCDPVKHGNGNTWGKFVSSMAHLRNITRGHLCADESEEEYKYCAPSVRKVKKCQDYKRALSDETREAKIDCHLDAYTGDGFGYYQYQAAQLLGDSTISPISIIPTEDGENENVQATAHMALPGVAVVGLTTFVFFCTSVL